MSYQKYPASAGGVSSLNSLVGDLTLVEGSGVTISAVGSDITISASGGGGGPFSTTSYTVVDGDDAEMGVIDSDSGLLNLQITATNDLNLTSAGGSVILSSIAAIMANNSLVFTAGTDGLIKTIDQSTSADLRVTTGNSDSGNTSGALTLITGAGSDSPSGSAALGSGTAGADMNSGSVNISSGGTSGTGASGSINITTGLVADGTAGTLSLQGGTAVGDGNGGDLTLVGGTAALSGEGGTVTIRGGNCSDTGSGGGVNISGGSSDSNTAGSVTISAGNSVSSDDGEIRLKPLNGGSGSQAEVGMVWTATVTSGAGLWKYAQVQKDSAEPGTPEAGDVYYDINTNKLRFYNGSTWETVTSV